MPLLQDTNRGGGGSNENRRSLADILGLDTLFTDPPVSAPASTRSNDFGDSEWSWEGPGSPEIAQTPLALVPPGCFPPRHPRQYASYSESAQPGGWDELSNGQGITDLVASLKALGMPGPGRPLISYPPPPGSGSLSRDDGSGDPSWTGSRMNGDASSQEDRMTVLSRRSSFCGPGMSTLYRGPGNGRAMRWSGVLPARVEDPNAEFSSKLFLGGTPWDMSEEALMHALRHFNPLRVEWPGSSGCPRGFAYVTFESELKVRALLAACRRDRAGWFYKLHTRKCRSKEVEVIPWVVSEANWVSGGSARLAAARTVFVGALHGMLSAPALALIMNDLFSGVVYAGIDTDKHKYPIGSGRVTFDNVRSYVRAISAAYIEIRTDKFSKKVQVDPYLEDSMCSVCNLQQGPYFCREPTCFGYFCRSCWSWQHSSAEHRPLMRNSKSQHPPNGQRSSPPTDSGSCYGGYGSSTDGTLLTSPSTSGGPGTSGDLEASPSEQDNIWQH